MEEAPKLSLDGYLTEAELYHILKRRLKPREVYLAARELGISSCVLHRMYKRQMGISVRVAWWLGYRCFRPIPKLKIYVPVPKDEL
jgi:hypothetical protein